VFSLLKRVLLKRQDASQVPMFDEKKIEGYCKSKRGSAEWLIGKEMLYGGLQINVRRNKVSPYDPRSEQQIKSGGMIGGDRMYHHCYAQYYARYLEPFIRSENKVTLMEVGILRGTGLALWCDLFPVGRIVGLDIDLKHYENNLKYLKSCGAFQWNFPESYEFDQFVDNRELLLKCLAGDAIDICIDDGFHSNESVIQTFESMLPCLSDKFVYFIEDNNTVSTQLSAQYPDFNVLRFGELTIVKSDD